MLLVSRILRSFAASGCEAQGWGLGTTLGPEACPRGLGACREALVRATCVTHGTPPRPASPAPRKMCQTAPDHLSSPASSCSIGSLAVPTALRRTKAGVCARGACGCSTWPLRPECEAQNSTARAECRVCFGDLEQLYKTAASLPAFATVAAGPRYGFVSHRAKAPCWRSLTRYILSDTCSTKQPRLARQLRRNAHVYAWPVTNCHCYCRTSTI